VQPPRSPGDAAPREEESAAPAARPARAPAIRGTAIADAMPPPSPSELTPPSSPSAPGVPGAAPPPLAESTAVADAAPGAGEEVAVLEPPPDAAPAEPGAAAELPRRSPPSPREPWPWQSRRRAFGAPIATELGGLFYLVNLALYLRLYGAGSGDDVDDLPLPLWDFVALVGRELLSNAAAAEDPVWSLLAELAGRAADEPAGAGFAPPSDWRLPPRWLAAFDLVPVLHEVRDGRLSIAHPEGFLLVDVAARSDREAQLAEELAPYGGRLLALAAAEAPPAPPPPPPPAGAPLERWLARLLPYLRARLRGILGTSDAALPALLLAHRARVHATDTHLDIVMSLETLPVEIRFAGLDRDPGWVAAAGRFIAFHFE
jgi:hypothetical protein